MKPDWNRLSIVIEAPNNRLPMIDNINLISDDYADVGVEFIIRPIDNALWGQRMRAGEMQFVGWPMAKAATETDLVPSSTNTDWAPLWGLWYHTNGEQGREPPQEIKDLQDVWTRILTTSDEAERDQLYDTILRTQAENMRVIGVVGPLPKPVIRKTWFRNVKTDCTWSYHHGGFIGANNGFAWIAAGAVGIVAKGGARDTDELIKQRVPVYSRRVTQSIRPGRLELDSTQIPVNIGGVLVRPKDLVLADGDGVIVVPLEVAEEVAKHASIVAEGDKRGRRRIYEKLGREPDWTVDV